MQQKILDALQTVSVGQHLAREKFMELYNGIFSKSVGDSELYTIILEVVDSILCYISIANVPELETQYSRVKRIDETVAKLLRSCLLLLSVHTDITVYASIYLQRLLKNLPIAEMETDMREQSTRIIDEIDSTIQEVLSKRPKIASSSAPPLPRYRFTRTKNHLVEFTFSSSETVNITRKDLHLHRHAFLLENVLTPQECTDLITKSCDVGFKSIEDEFLLSKRDNKRILTVTPTFTELVWMRIKPFLEQDSIISNMKPPGFYTQGKWRVDSMNPCWRFCEYIGNENATGFKPHRDANFLQGLDERSALTCMIYLSDEFVGGNTNFFKSNGAKIDELIEEEMARGVEIVYELKPKAGTAIIFDHLLLHEGAPVLNGRKYLARTDIVFKRYDNPDVNTTWTNNKDYQRMVAYYREAAQVESEGNVEKSSELYERALSIKHTHGHDLVN